MRYLAGTPGLKRTPALYWGGLLVVLLGCTLILAACGPNPTETSQNSITPSSNQKISTVLLDIFVVYQTTQGSEGDKKAAAIQYARDKQVLNKKDEAVFELELDQPDREQAVTEKIKSMGGRVQVATNIEGTVKMRVAVPVDAFMSYSNTNTKDNFLADLAAFKGVKSIDLIIGIQPQGFQHLPESADALAQTATKNEGVKLMGADKWQAAGFKGKGVKIGVIDGGFKYKKKFLCITLPAYLEPKDIDAEIG